MDYSWLDDIPESKMLEDIIEVPYSLNFFPHILGVEPSYIETFIKTHVRKAMQKGRLTDLSHSTYSYNSRVFHLYEKDKKLRITDFEFYSGIAIVTTAQYADELLRPKFIFQNIYDKGEKIEGNSPDMIMERVRMQFFNYPRIAIGYELIKDINISEEEKHYLRILSIQEWAGLRSN